MKVVRLILGDQLNIQHSWFKENDDDILYVLMEIKPETDYVTHHIQKVLSYFSAMREFSKHIAEEGHQVKYFKFTDDDNKHSFSDNLNALIEDKEFSRFEYQEPDEYRLDKELRDYCKSLDIDTDMVSTEHFYTSRNEVEEFFEGKKQYLLENFYRHMRKKHDVMMKSDGEPLGDRWNFDQENRNKYKGEHTIPEVFDTSHDVTELVDMLSEAGVETMGSVPNNSINYPINREEALNQLTYFCKNLLPHFGRYQDAMHTEEKFLFHSRLSFALNSKIISPQDVVNTVVEYWEDHQDEADLAQLEGFVRQILGWREFMRGIYWSKMPDYASKNYFEFDRELPEFYWTGDTKMECMKHSIQQSLDEAYAHHIQRLMVTGNFALLNLTDPQKVGEWYLGIYIDAIEWVEMPNTHGMSQFADGGVVGTKPYIASANYMQKMSNYCKNCHYDNNKKHGDKACPFNSLYWNFYEVNREKLKGNQRVSMMYRVWDKKDDEEKKDILDQAKQYLDNINDL